MALSTDLVSYWKLDESSGNASDSVGSKTLTNNNSVTYSAGKINNGANFNGSNNYLDNSNVLSWNSYNSGLSLSFWVKFNNFSSTQDLFGFQDTSWSGVFCRVNSSTSITFRFGNGVSSDGGNTTATVSAMSTGTWYHIVMTHSSTANTYYLNGSQIAQRTSSVTLSGGGTGFSIGETYGAGVNFLNGSVDEFGIWTKELSSTEVSQLYNSGNGNQYPFGTAYTITAALGTYTLTGISNLLKIAKQFAVSVATFTLTGINALFKIGKGFSAQVGSYTITGYNIALSKTKLLSAQVGSYVLTGYDIAITKGKGFFTEVANFIITSQDVTLSASIKPVWASVTKTVATWTNNISKQVASWTNKSKNN